MFDLFILEAPFRTHGESDSQPASPLARDYEALVERCGLLDRSERGKLALSGAGAVEFLNGQLTNGTEYCECEKGRETTGSSTSPEEDS